MNIEHLELGIWEVKRYLFLLSVIYLLSFTTAGVQTAAAIDNEDSISAERQYEMTFHEALLQRQKGNHDAAFDLLSRCLELNPKASEACFFLAQYFTEMKNSDKAFELFKRATELEPKNMTYMETLAQAYVAKEQYEEAIDMVEKMYDIDKSRQELLETLFRLYTETKDYEGAINALERIETIDGKTERTSLAKSRLYMAMKESEKAIDEMKSLADQYPNDPSYKTIYASALMSNGDNDKAYDVIQEVLAEDPTNIKALQALFLYYTNNGERERADSISRSILLNPKSTTEEKVYELRIAIAHNEEEGGDSTQVLKLFRDVLDQPNPDADIAEMLAAYMELKKMPSDSVDKALEKVLELDPGRTSARLMLVQSAWQAEDKDRIISLCQEARQYTPEEMAFYYYQGIAYYTKDDKEHALEAFKNGISVINESSSPEIVSDFYSVMGDILYQKGRRQEAFEAYDSCLQWKPDNIGCLNNYAYYLSLLNERLDEAEHMSFITIKTEPENATYLDTYAWILFMQKRYKEALIYIDRALEHDSLAGPEILEHAGDIHAMAGDADRAVELWQQALAKENKNKVLIRKIKKRKYLKR